MEQRPVRTGERGRFALWFKILAVLLVERGETRPTVQHLLELSGSTLRGWLKVEMYVAHARRVNEEIGEGILDMRALENAIVAYLNNAMPADLARADEADHGIGIQERNGNNDMADVAEDEALEDDDAAESDTEHPDSSSSSGTLSNISTVKEILDVAKTQANEQLPLDERVSDADTIQQFGLTTGQDGYDERLLGEESLDG